MPGGLVKKYILEQNEQPQHVTLEIKVLAWDRHKSVAGSPNPPLLITESETAMLF
jgi:hypothetical protein